MAFTLSNRNKLRTTAIALCLNSTVPLAPHAHAEREIDRADVLTEGSASWDVTASLASVNSTLYPLTFRQGLSSRWTLVWMPVPFEARFLISRSESQHWTLRFNILGNLYMRPSVFDWSPFIETTFRHKLTEVIALEGRVLSQAEIRRTGPSPNLVEGLSGGVLFQLGSSFWVMPVLATWLEINEPRSLYVVEPGTGGASSRLRFPILFNLGARFGSFAISGEIQLFSLGYATPSQQAFVRTSLYW